MKENEIIIRFILILLRKIEPPLKEQLEIKILLIVIYLTFKANMFLFSVEKLNKIIPLKYATSEKI